MMKITDEQLAKAVEQSTNMTQVLTVLGIRLTGGSHSHYSRRVRNLGLDCSHHTGKAWNKGQKGINLKRTPYSILIKRDAGRREKTHLLRRALIYCGIAYSCALCGQLPTWQDQELVLQVDHINNDWLDDRIENLRFLCPNCHSQRPRLM